MPSLADYPREPLTFGPSPIQRLDRLTRHLGGATVWAKREDCNSGLAFGGNKVRKLEYLLADALAQGCDTLVSIGGVQSNHTRQVAAVAAHAGLGASCPGALGRLARRHLRPGRQHPAVAADGRRRAAGPGRVRDRVQAELGAGDRRRRGRGRQALPDPGRRLGPPAGRPRVRGLGVRGRRAGARAGRRVRHDRRVLGHGLHAGGHGRRVRGARGCRRAASPGRGDRRLGDAVRDPGAGAADRAADGGGDRAGARAAAGRGAARRPVPRRGLRDPR